MKNKKTSDVLKKLGSKTFKDVKKKQVFEPAMIFGSTLDDNIGILLTANESATKIALQIGKTKIFLNEDSLDFLIKTIVTMGAMVAAEGLNAFSEKIKPQIEGLAKDDRVKFSKIMSTKSGDSGITDAAKIIISNTDKLVLENVLGSALFPNNKNVSDADKKLMLVKNTEISDKLFERIEDDLIELKKSGTNVLEEDFLKISNAIAFNIDCAEKLKGDLSALEMESIAKQTVLNFIELTTIHKDYYKDMSQEKRSEILEGLIDSFKGITTEPVRTKEKSKAELQKETDDLLDQMLAEKSNSPETRVSKIEEGVMEEVVEEVEEVVEEKPAAIFDFNLPEQEEEKVLEEVVEKVQVSKYNEETEDFQAVSIKESSLFEIEVDEEDVHFEDQQDSLEYDARDDFGEDPEKLDAEEFSDFDDDATGLMPGSGTPVEEDEDEEEEAIDDDFVKRMEDVESMLSGNFEKLEEEIPTFEKIEQLKMEHGELAAKEYVASLSQEQREALVKERLEARVAAQESRVSNQQE